MSRDYLVFIAALVAGMGGRVELTDMDLMVADSKNLRVSRDVARRTTIIGVFPFVAGPLVDLGEATIEPDAPKGITP